MSEDRTAKLSKLLPPSLGTLFGHPFEAAEERPIVKAYPATIPGARNAAELCCIVDQYRPDLLPRDAIAEVKIDGHRCLYIAGHLWTREGSPFEAAEHCLPILRGMEAQYGVPMVFDGEYVEDGGLESTLAAFRSKKGNGCLWLFDAVPLDQWQSGRASRQTLILRKLNLRDCLMKVTERRSGVPVGYIEHVQVKSPADVEARAQDVWRAGFEGIVVKAAGSFYLRKRTCDWMKVKLRTVSTMDVVDVVGCERDVEVVEGDKRIVERRRCAKTLLVRLPGHDGKRPVGRVCKVPIEAGGLSETLWQHRGDLMNGGTVEVEHAGFTGAGNPREAILKSVNV